MLSLTPRFGSFFDEYNALGSSFGPAVHVRESIEGLYVELEVPRYRRHELVTEANGSDLIITGNRDFAAQHLTHGQLIVGEAPMSHFRRVVHIPSDFDVSRMTTLLENGVLSVLIPHAPLPPPPQPLHIAGAEAPASTAIVPAVAKDSDGLIVTATSTPEEFNAVAIMKWPPKVRVDDTADKMTYIVSMPHSVTKDHIELTLEGRFVHLVVHHRRNVIKRNSRDVVVFNQDQSVSYSTNLQVPEGTLAGDISTAYTGGHLVLIVSKHDNPTQTVPVTSKKC